MRGVAVVPNPRSRRALVAAVVASFFVYLVPLVGPHAIFTVGEVLWRDLFPSTGHKTLAWRLADCAVALASQLALGALCYAVFRARRRLVALVFVVAIPLLTLELNWLLWLKIPERFLIERVDAPERSPWPEQCAIGDAWLAPLPAMMAAGLNQAGVALVRTGETGFGVLRVPACTVDPLPMPAQPGGSMRDVISLIPSGKAIAKEWVNAESRDRYWVVAPGHEPALIGWLHQQPSTDSPPALAPDGETIAWLHRIEGVPPFETEVRLQSVDGSHERRVTLNKIGPASFVLVAVTAPAGSVMLSRNLTEFRTVAPDGETSWGPFEPPGVSPQPHTFVQLDGGWMAWDAYRDDEPYRIAWSTPGGQGVRLIPRGSGITSAAISADGGYVAFSTTTSLNIGRTQDAVVVLHGSDGAEVLRKTLPAYTRSTVAFLGPENFAYSDVKGAHSITRVLKMR